MSATSPELTTTAQVTFTVKVNGEPIDDSAAVVSIDVWVDANKVPRARLALYDGSPASRDFALSSLPTFLPGNDVEIAAGYGDGAGESTLFRGVIAKQGIKIGRVGASQLIVDVVDEALKMTLERRDASFEDVTDGDLITKLIRDHGLDPDVEATKTRHEEVVQYYSTDWDLMLMRAQMNGLVVTVDAGKVSVRSPDTRQPAALRVEYGQSVLELRAVMDASTQYAASAIKSSAWDYASQTVVEAGPGTVNVEEQGDVSSAELAEVFAVRKLTQQSGGAIEKTSLQEWSSAELLKSKLAKIRGEVCFQGSSLAQTGKTIELAGLGGRFNGTAYISGVHHRIADGSWLTTVRFGMSPEWFAARAPDIAAPDASGLLPPIKGVQTGIVKKVEQDPAGEYRVFVNLPLLQEGDQGAWVRLGSPYASKGVGVAFYPELGDEVLVGFMNQDPRYGVILGSVYSKKLAPPYPPDRANTKKAIVTKGKLEIYFDDENGTIEIKTPGKHTIKMDDKSGTISIEDSNRNFVKLAKGGIVLDSAASVDIKAARDVTIDAKGNLKLKAAMNATMDGMNVTHSAKTKLSAKGSASAELTSSGILTVRGSLVKIN